MSTSRRSFIKNLGIGAGALTISNRFFPSLARAQATPAVGRNFLFVYFSGAWDTLLSLDPRDPNVFTESRIGETGIQLGWDRLDASYQSTGVVQPSGSNIALGPTMVNMAQHYDVMSVVRGMSMDTLSHDVGRKYFITGLPPRGSQAAGSAMGTRIAAQQGDTLPVPNLVAGGIRSYNEGDPPYASALSASNANDLVATLQDGPQAPTGAIRSRLDAYRAAKSHCDPVDQNRRGLLSLIDATQLKARDLVSSGVSELFRFNNQSDPEISALRARYGMDNDLGSPAALAALSFQALQKQVAQSVTVQLVGGLDTHDDTWATDHPDRLKEGFDALAQLITDLKTQTDESGTALIDKTTVVVFSEFGRTPKINNRDGRDHSLTSACLLLGAGVPHNKVIGASSDVGMNPSAIDPMSGATVSAGGVIPTPTLVLASTMAAAGYDTDKLRSSGLPCLIG